MVFLVSSCKGLRRSILVLAKQRGGTERFVGFFLAATISTTSSSWSTFWFALSKQRRELSASDAYSSQGKHFWMTFNVRPRTELVRLRKLQHAVSIVSHSKIGWLYLLLVSSAWPTTFNSRSGGPEYNYRGYYVAYFIGYYVGYYKGYYVRYTGGYYLCQ